MLVASNGTEVRVFGNVEDVGSREIGNRNAELAKWCDQNMPPGSICKVTGTAHWWTSTMHLSRQT